jgi:hypothetical protein
MVRKTLVATSALALAVAALGAGSGAAYAKTLPVNATGTLHCTVTGKTKLVPPKLFTGTSPAVDTQKVKLTNCTGTSGVTSGKGTIVTNTINSCVAPAVGSTGTFKWKGVGKYNQSVINLTAGSVSGASVITATIPSSSITGSFQSETATLVSVQDQTVGTFITACGPKTKGVKGSGGLKKTSYTGVNGPSTFDIG